MSSSLTIEAPEMMLNTHQRLALEVSTRRERAEAVLNSLLAAKAECERQLARFKRPDMIKSVTGQSALDAAITSTKRMIDSLNQTLAESRPVEMGEVCANAETELVGVGSAPTRHRGHGPNGVRTLSLRERGY